jgi:uncharacterized protein (TIGR03083 family)
VTEKRGDHKATPPPRDRTGLTTWFRGASETLVTALQADPSTEAWTIYPPRTVAFWRRRRALEALVHRWDAEHALGTPTQLDPTLAAEGVSEVIDTMFPRQLHLARAEPPEQSIRLAATDTNQTWTLGPSTPAATLHGTAPDLFLLLWGRLSPENEAITWEGNQKAGLHVLNRPITP